MGEQIEQNALTLVQAAERLGVKPAAVRMRWKRGKIRGFKQSGRVFVYLNTAGERTEHKDEQSPKQSEQSGEQQNDVVIEFQRIELERIKQENQRLNDRVERMDERIDNLLASHAQERDREQVLRQQLQNQIDRLTEQRALPAPDTTLQNRLAESERDVGLLKGGLMQLLRYLEKRKA
tara:strand:+ start:43 stop:576 length:534 start_codon:yes stop_codon:yes gene_type:complete